MRKYAKIVAICLIAVLSLGMLSACGGANYTGKDNSFMGMMHGISKSVQDTTETQTTTQNSTVYVNSYSSDSNNNNNDQQTPNGDQQTPENNGDQQTPENNGDSGNTETPGEEDLSNGINNYTTVCMSFNLLLGDSTGKFSPLSQRAVWQMEIINKHSPDLLGCQEITFARPGNGNFDVVKYIVDNGPNYEYYTYTGSNTMFWKKDRFELKDKGFEDYTYGGGFGITWVLLYDKKEQITTLFTNCHLSPGGTAETEEARQREGLWMMNNVWKKKCGKDVALYATGDYNTTLGSPTINVLSKEKFKSCADVTLNANAASNLDHVFINNDIQECVNLHIAQETFEPEGMEPGSGGVKYWASDHKAVAVYCNYSKRKK